MCDAWLYDHLSACKTVLFITGFNCIRADRLILFFYLLSVCFNTDNLKDVIFYMYPGHILKCSHTDWSLTCSEDRNADVLNTASTDLSSDLLPLRNVTLLFCLTGRPGQAPPPRTTHLRRIVAQSRRVVSKFLSVILFKERTMLRTVFIVQLICNV